MANPHDDINRAVIGNVQTSATGANYTALPNFGCVALDIVNYNSANGADIEYIRTGPQESLQGNGSTMGGTNSIIIPNGSSRKIVGLNNANLISIRRVDQSNTQLTVRFEALR